MSPHRRAALVGLATAALGAVWPPGTAAAEEPAPALGSAIDFELADTDGGTVRAADLRGRWLLVFFGYTFCPDLCPTALSEIVQALAELGPMADRVQPVFVSFDPERDSPEVLHTYVRGLDQRIMALSGSAEQIARAARSFGVVVYKTPGAAPGEYGFAHSAVITLIGPEGGLVARFTAEEPAETLAGALRKLLGGDAS